MHNVVDSLRCIADLASPSSDASDVCTRATMVARFVFLAMAWMAAAAARDDSNAHRSFTWVAALFVASLVVHALFLPFAVLALATSWRHRPTRYAGLSLGAAVAVAVAVEPPRRAIDDLLLADADPMRETVYWARKDNPFRARFWAAVWSGRETTVGEGLLALARAEWEVGHPEKARSAAARVATSATDAAVRQRAAEQLRSWEEDIR